jgi:serine protease Do/serine protease DegQ
MQNMPLKRILFLIPLIAAFSALAPSAIAGEDIISPDHFPLDNQPLDRSNAPVVTSYADQIDSVKEAVVAVYTARKIRVMPRSEDPREEMLRQLFGLPPMQESAPESDEKVRSVPSGQGSGVIVSADGYILTNNHVISDRNGKKVDEVFVTLSDGSELDATIIGYDEKTDIAVLKVDASDLPYARMADSDNLRIGDVVFAIGNPMGIGRTVTMGIISATSRDLNMLGDQGYESFIQTDAAINMGNSGGALVDAYGRLIGINTAIVSPSGGSVGIGFAVPMSLARSILVSLATDGEVRRGMLGIILGKIDTTLAESFGLPNTEGAIVNQVTEGLPAAKAGIKVEDIILSINGQKIKDPDHLRLTVASHRPGTEVEILLLRDGKEKVFKVTLADFDQSSSGSAGKTMEIMLGVEASELNTELREQFGIPRDLNGVVVTDIKPDSPYARTQLMPGLVILRVNGTAVSSIKEARSALQPGINRLYVFHRGAFGFIGVRVN